MLGLPTGWVCGLLVPVSDPSVINLEVLARTIENFHSWGTALDALITNQRTSIGTGRSKSTKMRARTPQQPAPTGCSNTHQNAMPKPKLFWG